MYIANSYTFNKFMLWLISRIYGYNVICVQIMQLFTDRIILNIDELPGIFSSSLKQGLLLETHVSSNIS